MSSKALDAFVEPLDQLPGPEGRLAPGGHELLQFGEGEFFEIKRVSHGRNGAAGRC